MKRKKQHMKDANFSEKYMDLTPNIPEPKTDWIENKLFDVPYGSKPHQILDIYYPNNKNLDKYPLLIHIHGGGFSHMQKRDWGIYPGFFWIERGYMMISIEYGLAPKFKCPSQIEDCDLALEYLIKNKDKYKIDVNNIFIYGASAGGSLSSILGAKNANNPEFTIRGVAALCPVIDCYPIWLRYHKRPLVGLVLRKMFKDYLGYIPKNKDNFYNCDLSYYLQDKIPPFYFQLGRLDPIINCSDWSAYATLLSKKTEVVLDILEEGYHMGATKHFFLDESINGYLDFFENHIQ
ncbi:MAG: alpha/beta hydrolase [Acholeplasmatales bacterium]|jgi:acetyl esterase/lipase|nr:alpha/beta hydrolase [Acholeplasmatales bacterium]